MAIFTRNRHVRQFEFPPDSIAWVLSSSITYRASAFCASMACLRQWIISCPEHSFSSEHVPILFANLTDSFCFRVISGCCLQYLPGMIGTALKHIRVFNNTRLTHYPLVYERFLRLHYDYWSENVVRWAPNVLIFASMHLRCHWLKPIEWLFVNNCLNRIWNSGLIANSTKQCNLFLNSTKYYIVIVCWQFHSSHRREWISAYSVLTFVSMH